MKAMRGLLASGIVFCLTRAALCQAGSPTTPASMPPPVMGKLVKVDGSNLIVNARQRVGGIKEVIVATDDKTEFTVDVEPGKLTDLKPDMTVYILTVPAQGSSPAKLIVGANSTGLTGTVVKVDGKNVVLSARQQGSESREVTVATNENTIVILLMEMGQIRHGTVADLKADMRVVVLPETGTAAKIIVYPTRGGRSPATTRSVDDLAINSTPVAGDEEWHSLIDNLVPAKDQK